jgi:hypothetical protein
MEVAMEAAATLTRVFPIRIAESSSLSLLRVLRINRALSEPFFSRYSKVKGFTEIKAVSDEEKKALKTRNRRNRPIRVNM